MAESLGQCGVRDRYYIVRLIIDPNGIGMPMVSRAENAIVEGRVTESIVDAEKMTSVFGYRHGVDHGPLVPD
jgi:hypothetical protein